MNNIVVTVTHGHYYNALELPPNCGEVFIQGHTHIPMLTRQGERIVAIPGSVSRPKGSDLRCYILLDGIDIVLKTLERNIISSISI